MNRRSWACLLTSTKRTKPSTHIDESNYEGIVNLPKSEISGRLIA